MNNKKNLILVPFNNLSKLNLKNSIFLGDWCRRYSPFEKIKSEPYHWSNYNKIEKDNKKLQIYYEKLLKEISLELEKIHKIKKNDKFWRILIGPWLCVYLTSIYDKWEILRIFFNNKNRIHIICPKKNIKKETSLNTLDFINKCQRDDFWNYEIFIDILKFEYSKKIQFKSYDKIFIKKLKFDKKIKKNNTLKTLFLNFLTKIGFFYNKIIIENPYASKKTLIKIFFKILQIPTLSFQMFKDFDFIIDKSQQSKRNSISIDIDSKDNFLRFVRENLKKNLPVSLIENFYAYKNSNNYISKLKNKKIFTSSYYFSNEKFKFWLAELSYNKNKIFVVRHGGFLNQIEVLQDYFNHEINISNKYCNWNKNNTGSLYLPPIDLEKFKYLKKNSNNSCLIVEPDNTVYNIKSGRYPYNENYLENINLAFRFLNNLESEIRSNVITRSLSYDGKIYLPNIYKKKFPDIQVCNLKKSFKERLSTSKILIIKYLDTPVTQALVSDVPFIILVPKNLIRKYRHKKIYDLMIKNHLLFYNPIKASTFINKNWKNINHWWKSQKVENCKKILKKNSAILNSNYLDEYKNTISK